MAISVAPYELKAGGAPARRTPVEPDARFRGVAANELATRHDALKARGFVIYAGQGGLSAELFRISTMGNIHAADIDRLLRGFSELAG